MANLLSWLGNTAKKVERQVNPWDGGATYSHPAAPPQRYQPQQPTRYAPQQGGLSVQPVQQAPLAPPAFHVTPTANLQVHVAPPQPLQVGNQTIQPSPNAQVKPDNTLQRNQLLHPNLAQQVKTGLQQKLTVPLAAAQTVRQEFLPSPKEIRQTYQSSLQGKHPGLAPLAAGAQASAYLPEVGLAAKGLTKGFKALDSLAIENAARNPASQIGAVGKDVNGRNLTPRELADQAHQAKLAKNNLTQNEYAGLHQNVTDLEKAASQAQSATHQALDAAPKDATGKLTPQGQAQVKQALDTWTKAQNDHLAALNKVRIIDGEKPITVGGKTPIAKPTVKVKQNPPTPVSAVGKNVNKPTPQELKIGKALGMSESDVANAKNASSGVTGKRNMAAEQAALSHLQNGGLKDEAVKIYQDQAGATRRSALFQLQRAAKESNVALKPNPASANPELANFKTPHIQPNDWTAVEKQPRIVNKLVDLVHQRSQKALGGLSPADRNNFIHYVQGTKDIAKSENPKLTGEAVSAFRQGANTVHALDTKLAGGNTRFIKNFFPDYWSLENPKNLDILQLKDEQAAEENVGPETWRNMNQQERQAAIGDIQQRRTLDTGNYSGFHNKQRIFANRQEGLKAGMVPLHSNPAEDINRYFTGAKLNISNQALIRAARAADVNSPIIRNSIDLPGDKSFQTSDQGYAALKKYARKQNPSFADSTLPTGKRVIAGARQGMRGLNTAVIKTIVANPVFHGGNQEVNALYLAAGKMRGNPITNMVGVIAKQRGITEADRMAFYKEGNFSPTYGKDRYGVIAKAVEKAGIDPKNVELSPRAMAKIEENVRIATWKRLRASNYSPEAATTLINKGLGGPDIVGDMASSVGLFLHYFKTNAKLLGDIGVQAGKGNFRPAAAFAAGLGAWYAADKAWQRVTNNPSASVRAPGLIGTAMQLARAPGQLKKGSIPSVVTNHLNPAIVTAVEETTNRDLHRPVAGPKAQFNTLSGKYGSGRAKTAVRNLVGPAGTVQDVAGQRASVPAAALGYAAGLYNTRTPASKPGANTAANSPTGKKLTSRELKGNNPDELTRWQGMTAKARANVRLNNPDKYVRDQNMKVQQEQNQGDTTAAFKDQRAVQQTQIQKNFDKNIVGAYGLNATDFKAFISQASQDQLSQLHSLDSQMVDAGLVAKSKFPKAKSSGSGGSRVASGRTKGTSSKGFKVAKFTIPKIAGAKAIKAPKGIKIKSVAAFKAPRTRKLAVSKIPRIKVG